jgi:hypothetical protein
VTAGASAIPPKDKKGNPANPKRVYEGMNEGTITQPAIEGN